MAFDKLAYRVSHSGRSIDLENWGNSKTLSPGDGEFGDIPTKEVISRIVKEVCLG